MISPQLFLEALKKNGIQFVTGVPDSLLKDVCACITDNLPKEGHIIATNEGSAIGMAIGHYLANQKPSLVYMQNSGLGNSINPITSLADRSVYGIPMILMIGWRGEVADDGKQIHDEPQHKKQGLITKQQLELLDVPHEVVDSQSDIESVLSRLTQKSLTTNGPVALLVRKQTFAAYKMKKPIEPESLLTREAVIECVLKHLPTDIPIVATTGMASRELFEIRKKTNQGHSRDFLTVGGMGHASQIAAGIALTQPKKRVICLDGDGAVLMHSGALAISSNLPNLIHVVINNGAHDSVGGQPTRANEVSLKELARVFGYQNLGIAENADQITRAITNALEFSGSSFIEIKCRLGARADLGRPDRTPVQNRDEFMQFLKGH